MYSKTRTAILCCAVLAAFTAVSLAADATAPAKPKTPKAAKPKPATDTSATGGSSTPGGAAATAQPAVPLPQEISIGLDEMLKMVNEGKKPSKDDVAAVDNILQQNKKNLLKFDAPGKTKYSMLSAWDNYFAGNMDAAFQAASAGLMAGPDDPDMKATFAAMAIAAEKYPMLGKLSAKPAATKKKPKTGEMEEPQTPTEKAGSGVLNFDAAAMRPQAAGKKVAAMDATYNCLGGTSFMTGKSDLLCVLAWRSVNVPKPAKTTSTTGSEEGAPAEKEKSSDSDPSSAFGALMVDCTGSDKVSFVGVNLDDAAAKYNAMKEVSAKGWFWPQVMAMEPANKAFAELAKFDVSRPTMAIMTKDGTITYMGSPAGFLPKMLVAKATGDYAPKLFVPAKPAGTIDPNARKAMMRANDPNMRGRRSMDPNAVKGKTAGGDVDEAMQMGSDLKAEELYNNAKSFLKGSRTTTLTAGPGVQCCRQILQLYPNTEYAGKARELLRQLPDELKTRYNITSAEMGQ